MLRSAASLTLRHSRRAVNSSLLQDMSRSNYLLSQSQLRARSSNFLRTLSTKAKEEPPKKKGGKEGDDDPNEIVLTPGETVVAVSRLGLWAGIFGFACACAYYIGRELIPTKMSPNSVFNSSSAIIRENAQVKRVYGDKIKFYGKDHGGHREGRRNFIEHTQYPSPDDGSNRTRVRFNLEGEFNSAFCFAEVSSEMSSGEFVYILVQDKRSGRVITVADNRAALTAKRLAGGNNESSQALQQLLGGGKS
mmetsp:Transcript_24297/g.59505  ORF Transcript_24297/g.59505 Transcript_24297/m.59505 type:complete len:249 (+) Transcript_24297:41-787(+)